ncbi:hypothetical protein C4572_00550 [Candidatus Parcubacteria bacterium]|nr:MAG: hypothetical protein C4572_00550 [Candidatus Parcubacteria bacterium]
MADEELKVLLRENIRISKENLEILRKMNRSRIYGNIFWAVKWVIILGISFGAYYYVNQYLAKFMDSFDQFRGGVENINKISNNINSVGSGDLLKNLQNLLGR